MGMYINSLHADLQSADCTQARLSALAVQLHMKVSACAKQHRSTGSQESACLGKAAQKRRVTRKCLHGKRSTDAQGHKEGVSMRSASTEAQGEHLIALTPLVWPLQVCTQRLGRKQCSFSAFRSLGASSQLRPA